MSKKTASPSKAAEQQNPVEKTDAAAGGDASRPSRFDPFAPARMSEWFDRWPELFARRWPESFQGMSMPFVEAGFRMEHFVDDDGVFVVRGELPGLDPDEDITIVVDGDHLTISGKREERSEEKSDDSFRSEFHYGTFKRDVRLPAGAQTSAVTASYTDGILEVRVPTDHEQASATTIPISTKR